MSSSTPILREPGDYDEGHHERPGPDPLEQGDDCQSIRKSIWAVTCDLGRVSVLARRHRSTSG